MTGELFGEQHQAIVEWLTGPWRQTGRPIAAIQGFPGLGKTAIAEQVLAQIARTSANITTVHIDCPEASSTLLDDLVLGLAEGLDAKGDSGIVEALGAGVDAEGAFRELLNRPRLIVIDEAQRLMHEGDGTPKGRQIQLALERLSHAAGAPGRLLLLSSREFGGARWEEHADIVTLKPLKALDAQSYLTFLLEKEDRADAVGADRIADVASWLGGNPRAISLVVSALRRDTLDFLIGLAPEAWEVRDREVAPKLLRQFEERVLTRAVEQLDEEAELFLRRLAVFRKPFPRNALEAVATADIDMERSRDELLDRYIVEFRSGYYRVHPIVRDTLLHPLSPAQRRSAHKTAGNYYASAFRAKKLVGQPEALGARFVEARYHFTQAESESDLRDIAGRFEEHLRNQFSLTTPIPSDPQELDDRITLLSALLKERGPVGMEYHLARCLLKRGRIQDIDLALPHARRSTGARSPAPAWTLRIQVEAGLFGATEAVKVAREGIKVVPPTQNLFSLYQIAGEILSRDGKSDEAVALLRKGMKVVPPGQGLFSLYQIAGEILSRDGKSDEAVTLLREGMKVVPPGHSLSSLYQIAGEILSRDGKSDEAVTLLREGMKVVPLGQSLSSLYQAAGEILSRDGKSDEAVTLLREGIKVVPPTQSLFSLYQAAGEILSRDGKSDEAVTLLREGVKVVPPTQNLFSLYQAAGEILVRDGKSDEAVTLLREGIKVVPPTQNLFSLYQIAGEILSRNGKSDEAVTLLREGARAISNAQNRNKLVESAILIAADFGQLDVVTSLEKSPETTRLFTLISLISREQFADAVALAESYAQEFPRYFAFFGQGAFAALAGGEADQARHLIKSFGVELNLSKGASTAWLMAAIELKGGNIEGAKYYLDAYADRAHANDEVSLSTLMSYWRASCREFRSSLSYHFPRIPGEISGLDVEAVRHHSFIAEPDFTDKSNERDAPGTDSSSALEPHLETANEPGAVSVLAVATEWSSGRGGLSTVNRQLCIALAQAGAKVACIVLDATTDEVNAAAGHGVTLVGAGSGAGLTDAQRLIGRPVGLEGFVPDILIGHGRITGPAAAALQANYYPTARRVHFVHMAPDEIEPYKLDREDQAGERAQVRTELEEELGRSAARVVAVGPRLHGRFSTYLAGYRDVPAPLRFDPGFDTASNEARLPPEGDPWNVLLLGRAEDVYLKGLDTAASAVAKAAAERPVDLPRLELVIRGAQPAEMDQLRANLLEKVGSDRLNIVIRAFTISDEELQADLRRASLVLMPSRAEGFGLVGLEAVVAGTPVLISAESGLGQLLREQLPAEQAARVVVAMNGDDQQLRDRWAGSIERMLADRETSFRRAAEMRAVLATKRTWLKGAETLLAQLMG